MQFTIIISLYAHQPLHGLYCIDSTAWRPAVCSFNHHFTNVFLSPKNTRVAWRPAARDASHSMSHLPPTRNLKSFWRQQTSQLVHMFVNLSQKIGGLGLGFTWISWCCSKLCYIPNLSKKNPPGKNISCLSGPNKNPTKKKITHGFGPQASFEWSSGTHELCNTFSLSSIVVSFTSTRSGHQCGLCHSNGWTFRGFLVRLRDKEQSLGGDWVKQIGNFGMIQDLMKKWWITILSHVFLKHFCWEGLEGWFMSRGRNRWCLELDYTLVFGKGGVFETGHW